MPVGGHGACLISKKAARLLRLEIILRPVPESEFLTNYLTVVLGEFVVAARLVSVAGEHDIEHARADR